MIISTTSSGSMLLELLEDLEPAHLGQHHVHDRRGEVALARSLDALRAGLGERHLVAGLCQHPAEHVAHHLLVVDDEDRLLAHLIPAVRPRASTQRRQRDLEGGALARVALDEDRAPVLLHDPVRDRQPEPGALADALGGEERVVDAPDVLAADPVAGVAHLDHHGVVVGMRAQRQPAAARHRVARVQDQVEEHLLDAVLVAAHRRHVLRQLAPHPDPRAVELVLDEREHVGQHLVHVDLLELGPARAREVEQPVDDLRRAEALLLDLLEHLLARVVLLELAAQQLRVGRDPGERGVHLVRDAGGEQAHRGHLLGVLQLLLEPARAR